MSGNIDLEQWIPVDDYVAGKSRFFKSRESWRWFERHNYAALAAAGAISQTPAGKMVNPTVCERVVLTIGQERTARRAEQRGRR